MDSGQLIAFAEGIDAEHSWTIQRIIQARGLEPPHDAALALLLAGLIAGRAEALLESTSDAECRAVYESAKTRGRAMFKAQRAETRQ